MARAAKSRSRLLSRLRALPKVVPSFRRKEGPFDCGRGLTREAARCVGLGYVRIMRFKRSYFGSNQVQSVMQVIVVIHWMCSNL